MLSKGWLVLLTLAVLGDKGYVLSKPCFGLESLFDFLMDDSSEDKPAKPMAPVIPPKITVLLTPVADISSLESLIQSSNGSIYLLPSLLPLGQGPSTSGTTTTTTTTTTAAPPAAPAAAPAAAAPAAAAPGAAPAAGAATPAPAAAG